MWNIVNQRLRPAEKRYASLTVRSKHDQVEVPLFLAAGAGSGPTVFLIGGELTAQFMRYEKHIQNEGGDPWQPMLLGGPGPDAGVFYNEKHRKRLFNLGFPARYWSSASLIATIVFALCGHLSAGVTGGLNVPGTICRLESDKLSISVRRSEKEVGQASPGMIFVNIAGERIIMRPAVFSVGGQVKRWDEVRVVSVSPPEKEGLGKKVTVTREYIRGEELLEGITEVILYPERLAVICEFIARTRVNVGRIALVSMLDPGLVAGTIGSAASDDGNEDINFPLSFGRGQLYRGAAERVKLDTNVGIRMNVGFEGDVPMRLSVFDRRDTGSWFEFNVGADDAIGPMEAGERTYLRMDISLE